MEELSKSGCRTLKDEPMANHTTLCVGGPAEWYVEAGTLEQLRAVLKIARAKSLPVFFLGWGSNLLVGDKGIPGITLRLKGDFISTSFEDTLVRAGAGVFLPTLVKQCADKGLGGIEPLVGIPGSIGGALIMNAGTRDLEIGQVIKTVEVLNPDGNLELLNHNQVLFNYRASSLAGRVVCFATLQLRRQSKDDIIRTVQAFLEKRLETQPISNMNVGSIFKNPTGKFAAQLIEGAGLKGRQIGQAQVSPKHANFIVNLGGAKAQDVKDLIELVQKTVEEKHGVKLETEVKMVGL